MAEKEYEIQAICFQWFNWQYPEYQGLLFAVPNGEIRDIYTARKLKREGVVAGVSDLILLVGSNGFNSLCIEMKTDKGKQSDKQKQWQEKAEYWNNKYIVCHSFDEFKKGINDYLNIR